VAKVVEAVRGLRGPGVVAVSGGADSVALLRALAEARVEPLTVAHFNHRLRGAESDADAGFVRELAAGLGLPFREGSADVAAEGGNLEATARRLRYEWLAGVVAEVGAGWVATGHTLDDQAETVLHRLIRGTGLQGLRGIAAERALGLAGVLRTPAKLVRPLLAVTRADVIAYLRFLNQPFREDSSNANPAFTRNRIRHELLPLLRTFNPRVADVLGRLARQAEEAHDFIEAELARVVPEVMRPSAGSLTILDASRLTSLQPFLAREMLRSVWQSHGWSMDGMTADHWDRLLRIAEGSESAADFPGGIHVRRAGAVVQLGRRA
jgi:tRNA(Ile)-lysidine synthase